VTPQQIAHHEDIMAQRRMFVRFKRVRKNTPTLLKVIAFVVAVTVVEFALAFALLFGIGNGTIW
jgi:hypothetical protein